MIVVVGDLSTDVGVFSNALELWARENSLKSQALVPVRGCLAAFRSLSTNQNCEMPCATASCVNRACALKTSTTAETATFTPLWNFPIEAQRPSNINCCPAHTPISSCLRLAPVFYLIYLCRPCFLLLAPSYPREWSNIISAPSPSSNRSFTAAPANKRRSEGMRMNFPIFLMLQVELLLLDPNPISR